MAKMPKAKLTKLLLSELAAVPLGAQSAQGTVVLKRRPDRSPPVTMAKKSLLTSSVMGHSHLILQADDMQSGTTSGESLVSENGQTSYSWHSHPWVRQESGEIVIGEAGGHTHDIAAGSASLVKSPTTNAPRAQTSAAKSTVLAPAAKVDDMKLVILTEAQKAYYDKLSTTDAEAFVAKSHADREVDLQKAAAADPEVYKTDSGIVIRKSHGDIALMLAKQADESARQVAKANELAQTEKAARELTELKKRAKDTIGKLAGSDDVHCAILKAVESISDEKLRADAVTALKAANAVMLTKQRAPGSSGESVEDIVEKTAAEKLDALVEKHATEKSVDHPTAWSAVMKTAEGKRLYAESVGRA
jgi:hypothetical protein